MKSYHIIRNEEQTGPHTLEEITSKLTAGELSRNDLCWTEGMAEWAPIREVLPIVNATPPPPPPPKRSVSNSTAQAARAIWAAAQVVCETKFNRQPIKWIPALVFFCLMALFMCFVDLSLLENHPGDAEMFMLAGLPMTILGLIFQSLLHYKCWNSLPAEFRATTPGKAVGFMFIPFFNFYWAFISWPKLSEGLANWQSTTGIAPKNTKGLGIAFAVLFVCHWIFEILSIPALGVMIQIALLVIFILYYRTLVRGFNQMLGSSQVETEPVPSGFWSFKRSMIGVAVVVPLYWVILGFNYDTDSASIKSKSVSYSEKSYTPSWNSSQISRNYQWQTCTSCGGSGKGTSRSPILNCETCKGSRIINTGGGYVIVCPDCSGTGRQLNSCNVCNGKGKVIR